VKVEKSKGSRDDIGGVVGPRDGVSPKATDEGEVCAMEGENDAGLGAGVAIGIASVAGPQGTVCEVGGDGMYGVHTSDGTSHDLHTTRRAELALSIQLTGFAIASSPSLTSTHCQ